jgi:hypothetical protein
MFCRFAKFLDAVGVAGLCLQTLDQMRGIKVLLKILRFSEARFG